MLNYRSYKQTNGAVAQLGEHKAGSLGVRGSIPLSSTKNSKRIGESPILFYLAEGERTKGRLRERISLMI